VEAFENQQIRNEKLEPSKPWKSANKKREDAMVNPLPASCEVLPRDADQVLLVGRELLEEATLRAETGQGTSQGKSQGTQLGKSCMESSHPDRPLSQHGAFMFGKQIYDLMLAQNLVLCVSAKYCKGSWTCCHQIMYVRQEHII
jgi:hypothetical protein